VWLACAGLCRPLLHRQGRAARTGDGRITAPQVDEDRLEFGPLPLLLPRALGPLRPSRRAWREMAEHRPGSTTSSLSHGLRSPCIASFHSCPRVQRPRPRVSRAHNGPPVGPGGCGDWLLEAAGLCVVLIRWERPTESVWETNKVTPVWPMARIKLPQSRAPPCLEHSLLRQINV
jgi:hypothetical protein